MNKSIALCLVLVVSACQCNDSASLNKKTKQYDIDAILNTKSDILPVMCDIMTLGDLAAILGVEESDIIKRNSTPSGSDPKQRTCFFKWEDPSYPNSAIMIQAMRNPLGDEYPNYIVEMMNTKRLNGERTVDGDQPFLFTDITSSADEGLYNADIGKYFWRFSDKVIFHLAFNTGHGPKDQFKIASALGDKMIENYLNQ